MVPERKTYSSQKKKTIGSSVLRLYIPTELLVSLGALLICVTNIIVGSGQAVFFTVAALVVLLFIGFFLNKPYAILMGLFMYTPFSLRLNLTSTFSFPSDLLLFDLLFGLIIGRAILQRRLHIYRDSIISNLTGFVVTVLFLTILSSSAGLSDFSQDIRKIFYLLQYLIVFFVITNLLYTEQQLKISIKTLIVTSVVVSFAALVSVIPQFVSSFDIWAFRAWVPDHITRLLHGQKAAESAHTINNWITLVGNRAILRTFFPFINPMALAQYLLLIFPVILSAIVYVPKIKHRLLLQFALLIIGLTILFSFSRGVWLGMVVAIIVLFMSKKQMLLRSLFSLTQGKIPKWLLVLLLVTLGILIFIMVTPILRERLFSIVDFSNQSNTDRFYTWTEAWTVFQTSPIIGHGIGYAEEYYSHNTYLDILSQTGVIGFIMFVFIFISALFKLFYVRTVNTNDFLASVAMGWLGAICGLLVHFFFDNQFLFPQNGVSLVIVLALTTVLYRITKKDCYENRH